jgi:hypothetical protein
MKKDGWLHKPTVQGYYKAFRSSRCIVTGKQLGKIINALVKVRVGWSSVGNMGILHVARDRGHLGTELLHQYHPDRCENS